MCRNHKTEATLRVSAFAMFSPATFLGCMTCDPCDLEPSWLLGCNGTGRSWRWCNSNDQGILWPGLYRAPEQNRKSKSTVHMYCSLRFLLVVPSLQFANRIHTYLKSRQLFYCICQAAILAARQFTLGAHRLLLPGWDGRKVLDLLSRGHWEIPPCPSEVSENFFFVVNINGAWALMCSSMIVWYHWCAFCRQTLEPLPRVISFLEPYGEA